MVTIATLERQQSSAGLTRQDPRMLYRLLTLE